ncbi:MAG: hypothetical protein GY832_36245 [Chloroflexi bacterium]|nr:hypothetical protein [Chloroflexota bacterium]
MMSSTNDFYERIWKIIGARPNQKGEISITYNYDTIPEAKAQLSDIRQKQKNLRLVKKDVNAEIKTIRARYRERIENIKPRGMTSFLVGKGKAKSIAADEKRALRKQQDRELEPYDEIKRNVDNLLVQMDETKIGLTTWLDEQPAQVKPTKKPSSSPLPSLSEDDNDLNELLEIAQQLSPEERRELVNYARFRFQGQ